MQLKNRITTDLKA